MKWFPSYRERRQAKRRTVGWLFAAMMIVTLAYGAIVAVHYLGLW
jgi:hypothetical protein